jgi:hypothetical protein
MKVERLTPSILAETDAESGEGDDLQHEQVPRPLEATPKKWKPSGASFLARRTARSSWRHAQAVQAVVGAHNV